MKKLVIKKRKSFIALVSLVVLGTGGLVFYLLLAKMGLLMPLSELPSVLCLPSCTSEKSIHQAINNEKQLNYDRSLSEIIGGNIARDRVSILIEKSKYRLTVFYKLQPVKSYPVVLGTSPTGDKLAEGDRKTPE
jgi:murein L,D-transpeptidase YafK